MTQAAGMTAALGRKRLPFTAAAVLSMAACAVTAPAVATAAADGNFQYEQYCIACHGADARGVDGLGVDLVTSPFVAGISAKDLVEFLKTGRTAEDPQSQTNSPMPGFDWVSESDLQAVAAWLKGKTAKWR